MNIIVIKVKAIFAIFTLIICDFSWAVEQKADSLQSLRLGLDWYPTVEHACILVALDKGWYRQVGLNLSVSFDGIDTPKTLNAGKADVAMHSGHEVIRSVGAGMDLKAFAAYYQFNPLNIIANPEIISDNLKDLEGKTIGYFTEQELDVVKIMLLNSGIPTDKLSYTRINSLDTDKVIADFKARKFDAFVSWEVNEPISFAMSGYNVRQFASYRHGFHFYGMVFYAKDAYIKKHYKALAKFIKATQRGCKEAYDRPKYYAQYIVNKWLNPKYYIRGKKDLTFKQQYVQMKVSKRFLIEGVGFKKIGAMTEFQWDASIKVAKKYGLINQNSMSGVNDFAQFLVMKELEYLK